MDRAFRICYVSMVIVGVAAIAAHRFGFHLASNALVFISLGCCLATIAIGWVSKD